MENAQEQRNKAIMYLILSSLGFALMNAFVRMSGDLPAFQKAFVRNLVILFLSSIMMVRKKDKFFPKKENTWLLIARSFFGNIGMIANYYAVDHLIMSDATIIGKLSPFFTMIMSFLILKEAISPFQIGSILVSFLGTLVVIRPSFDLDTVPALVGVLGAFTAGIAYTLVRSLGQRGEKNTTIVFGFAFFSTIMNFPLMILDYSSMTVREVFFLLMGGLFAYMGQMCVTEAYSLAPSREISIFDYSQLLFAGVIGYFFFNELPDAYSFLGYLIILGASLALYLRTRKEDKVASSKIK